jgi:hypothetical protein
MSYTISYWAPGSEGRRVRNCCGTFATKEEAEAHLLEYPLKPEAEARVQTWSSWKRECRARARRGGKR